MIIRANKLTTYGEYKMTIIVNTVRTELKAHLASYVNDEILTNENQDDWHFHAFNEDHYMIGYYQCEQWLKKHEISAFEAIGICQEYEKENFGECNKVYDNAEKVVNMLVYIYGEIIISEAEAETAQDLLDYCQK